eukprot:c21097_g1_i1 orf=110-3070(+)
MALLGSENHQLDRLGRELKCPICLSLFKQAASLTCNHNFCRSCILESIKSKPACPICKVHTTRREVRAAPQMDNLVAILVSMGSAAGLDLIASQNMPVVAEPVEAPVTAKDKASRDRPALSNVTNRQEPPESSKQSLKSRDYTFKGAIPAKKRIQVPQPSLNGELEANIDDIHFTPHSHSPAEKRGFTAASTGSRPSSRGKQQNKRYEPPSESDAVISHTSNCRKAEKRAKKQDLLVEPSGSRHVRIEAHGKEQVALKEAATDVVTSLTNIRSGRTNIKGGRKKKGKDVVQLASSQLAIHAGKSPARDDSSRRKLDPFFWLRDESSQDTNAIQVTQLTQTQSTAKPNFSDLKDSDDDMDLHSNEEIANGIGVCGPDSYDSDVFDWTQLPCSPELRCSPSKNQGTHNDIVIEEVLHPATEGLSLNDQNVFERDSQDFISSKPKLESASKVALASQDNRKKATDKDTRRRKSCRIKACSETPRAVHLSVDVKTPQNEDFEQQHILGGCSADHQVAANQFTFDIALPDKAMQIKSCINRKRKIEKASKPQKKRMSNQKKILDDAKNNEIFSNVPDEPRVANKEIPSKGPEKCNFTAEPQLAVCIFCRASNNSQITGPMMHYSQQGVPLAGPELDGKIIHVHKYCAEWAPDVYFVGDEVKNLNAEAARGLKIKCNSCGKKGAALGCCLKRCKRSYHYPCARHLECKWDEERFILLCPEHRAEHFPVKKAQRIVSSRAVHNLTKELQVKLPEHTGIGCGKEVSTKWACGASSKWVLCGSALDSAGKDQLASFAKITGATISKAWSSSVTHVIAGTDLHGAARRTMKYLMAILEGKWILKLEWLAACIETGKPVSEEPFEIGIDIHGVVEGPKRGRLLVAQKASKLLGKLQFYFMPDFLPSYKTDLQALVVAGGGQVLHRKPVIQESEAGKRNTIVVYNNENPSTVRKADVGKLMSKRQAEAKDLAALVGAYVVPHQWILGSIGSSMVQPLE